MRRGVARLRGLADGTVGSWPQVSVATDRIQRLLDAAGTTYADEAGIRLEDKPAPLYQLLVLATLLSTRINAEIAVAAARELRAAGYRTPSAMLAASWQDRVDALGRAHYRRYDESTATRLAESATFVQDRYAGDLRRLAEAAGGVSRVSRVARAAELLQEFPGIGPVGADIFLREVQAVWTWVAPYLGDRAAKATAEFGVPHTARGLARAAGTSNLARIAAASIRASLDKDIREQVSS